MVLLLLFKKHFFFTETVIRKFILVQKRLMTSAFEIAKDDYFVFIFSNDKCVRKFIFTYPTVFGSHRIVLYNTTDRRRIRNYLKR